jgi:two-component system sensor histidine kinase DegS
MSQIIAGIFLKVQRWERVLSPGADQARREISSIKDMVHEVVVETSRMISELRQPLLDRGLWEALGRYADQWGRENEVLIERRLSGDDGLLSLEQQIAVYRIVQEALNNIRRHARAKRVNVTIRLSTKSLHGRIVDDGIGFDLGSVHGDTHFGLTGMSERASLEGGRLRIDSSPGMGTTLIFWLPLERGY